MDGGREDHANEHIWELKYHSSPMAQGGIEAKGTQKLSQDEIKKLQFSN